MQLQAANLVYIFDVIILSVTANKSGRLTVETSFLPLNSSKGGTLKCKPYKAIILKPNNTLWLKDIFILNTIKLLKDIKVIKSTKFHE